MWSKDISDKGKQLSEECEKAISSRRYDLLQKKGDELQRLGRSSGNHMEEIIGDALRLHALICVRDTSDFTLSIESLIKEVPTIKDANLMGYLVLNRTISAYYQRIINDYSQSLHYATENLWAARRLGDRNAEASALSSIASIYFQKQDPSGWPYAVESYELAKEIGDLTTRYVAACNMANYLYNNKKFEEASKYLKEAADFAARAGLDSEKSYINSFSGDLYAQLGQYSEAERFYRISLDDSPSTSNYDKIYSRLCYAIFLIGAHRLGEAKELLEKVWEMAREYKVTIFEKEIYSLMSRIYEEQGDYSKSLEYYKRYTQTSLELFSEQKEREFAILDLRNKVSEEERKNADQSLELMKRGRTIIILLAVGSIFIVICVAGFFYHRRKVAGYKQTVARYLENARSERHLREQLEAATADRQGSRQSGSLNDEKSQALYLALEQLMKEKHIYRDSSLSLEKAAGILSTNRTYLSQVVNEKAGKSFSSYVNEYRLNEAVELLSDSSITEPLKSIGAKVGFTSPSNFYTLFRQRVGVSPSVFRDNVKNIENGVQNHQIDNLN